MVHQDLYTEGEAPLRYRFFAEPAGTGKRHPLASGLSDQPSLRFLLPPGNARLHVEVLDQVPTSPLPPTLPFILPPLPMWSVR